MSEQLLKLLNCTDIIRDSFVLWNLLNKKQKVWPLSNKWLNNVRKSGMSILPYSESGFMQLLHQLLIQSQYSINKVLQYSDVLLRNFSPPKKKKKPVNALSNSVGIRIEVSRIEKIDYPVEWSWWPTGFDLWELCKRWCNSCVLGPFPSAALESPGSGGSLRALLRHICDSHTFRCFTSCSQNSRVAPSVWLAGVRGSLASPSGVGGQGWEMVGAAPVTPGLGQKLFRSPCLQTSRHWLRS